ncbi:hypothetical protein MKW98_016404 [Papaver atlanticum]|uniref:Uncharacterized protein n=1 Tax=Papaver atlanticum TaxID=357466 RepID=A0AAD4XTU0_9MAGN|nr:hypothetical protein MKW98_016404 [Papaver atlanticum]
MARTSITTMYTGFFFVLLVIFVTETAFGYQKLEPESTPLNNGKSQIKGDGKEGYLKGKEQVNAVDNNVEEKRKGKLIVNPANVGLHGRTDGSNNIGHGTLTQGNSLRGRGSLKSMKGRLRAKQAANVGKGLATAKLHVRPKGDLKKGNLKIEEGTGSVGVGRGLVKNGSGRQKRVELTKEEKAYCISGRMRRKQINLLPWPWIMNGCAVNWLR